MKLMKKLVAFTLVLTGIFLFSCDKVKDPIIKKNTAVGSKFVKNNNSAVSGFKKVLLEDFTGQRCPNCPDGSRIIKNTLIPTYNNTLVVVAVHAGGLANPYGEYISQDFRTAEGEKWNGSAEGFGITTWPTGLVNRRTYGGNDLQLTSTKWAAVVPLALSDPFVLKMDVNTEYDTTVRALNVFVKAKFLQAYSNDVKIVALITEDNIVGIQDDKGVKIEEYEFEHMMRGTLNGTWGTDLKLKPIVTNDTVSVAFKNFEISTKPMGLNNNGKGKVIVPKNVTVVVYAYDAVTREVLQAEQVKIWPSSTVAQ